MGMGTLGGKQGFMNGRSMGTSCQRAGFGAVQRSGRASMSPTKGERNDKSGRASVPPTWYGRAKVPPIERYNEGKWKGKDATHKGREWKGKDATHKRESGRASVPPTGGR